MMKNQLAIHNGQKIKIIKYLITILFLGLLHIGNLIACDDNSAGTCGQVLQTSELIEINLDGCTKSEVWLEGIALQTTPLLRSFYAQNNYAPVWTTDHGITVQTEQLIQLFKETYRYGIEPTIFNIDELENYLGMLQEEDKENKLIRVRASFEFLMTNSTFTLMVYLQNGVKAFNSDFEKISAEAPVRLFPKYLNQIIHTENFIEQILVLQPNSNEYTNLQKEIDYLVDFLSFLEDPRTSNHVAAEESLVNYLLNYIIKANGLKIESSPLDQEAKIKVIQTHFELRANGKLNNVTRNTLSFFISSRYAELAYRVEMIRASTNSYAWQSLIATSPD